MTLKIETAFDGRTATLRLIGHIESEYLDEIRAQVRRHRPRLVFDLDEVTLVDGAVVRFLLACEAEGIELLYGSPYIREWMDRESQGSEAMTSTKTTATTITEHEMEQVERANATGLQPIVFVHGLWLLPSSWDRWAALFEGAGYTTLQPGWPDDPDTVEEANAKPEVFAHNTVGQVADHFEAIIRGLNKKPAVIGHSFGGLLVQMLSGRGVASATVAIDPGPFRGVLPLPLTALKSAWPVLGNPANRNRAIPLTYEQFRFGFANAVSEEEARELYKTFAVPASGVPLFQAATANLNPWTEAKVDVENEGRGPVLIISGEKDNTVPWAIANASFKQQQKNRGVTEIVEMKNRGHALVIDSGWREVADTALAFIRRFV